MDENILDGKALAKEIYDKLSLNLPNIEQQLQRKPKLVIILIGNNIASETYVRSKVKACTRVGILSEVIRLSTEISETFLIDQINKLNIDNNVDGMIVQLPIPKKLDVNNIINSISPEKDVDGLHPLSFGKMSLGLPCNIPATPGGILEILKKYKIDTFGKNCVVLGRSRIVGLPISILLSQNTAYGNCTVTMCNSKTNNLIEYVKRADILISAIGKPLFIKEHMVKDNVIIIDVGMNKIEDQSAKKGYKLVGDVDFDNVKYKAKYITPVPGGVGPMTIAKLIYNTITAASKKLAVI